MSHAKLLLACIKLKTFSKRTLCSSAGTQCEDVSRVQLSSKISETNVTWPTDGQRHPEYIGDCSSVSQINSWTQLSSYSPCLNMQRGFFGEGGAALRKSVWLFSSSKSANFLIKFNSERLRVRRGSYCLCRCVTIPETCTGATVTSSPFLSPLIAHLLEAGQHPTHTQKSYTLSLSPFLWTALCANYSPFPWQWVAPLLFFHFFCYVG